eukprot:gnl/TRDRNA2_/TRDRNA2_175771_c0_seq1.p1 gnl/TRDRNA2_/TRDRNA2_175771_c0~~gnl/TRDRNA2_/TRDRNA2_175771_c0_seq1.p1  ORF type:complete len:434 (-),score=63.95 gnl/TRDRNA2_/TRDRNA2_175771_c0_seq1:33-1334(-)
MRCKAAQEHYCCAGSTRAAWVRGSAGTHRLETRAAAAISALAIEDLLAGGLARALAPPHKPLGPSGAVLSLSLRHTSLRADPELAQPQPEWHSARVGFPDYVSFRGCVAPCPLSALAECFNMRCPVHRAMLPQSRRNFETAVVAEVSAARDRNSKLCVAAVGAGLVYQEFRILQLLRERGICIARLFLIDTFYDSMCSEQEPEQWARLQDGITEAIGPWPAVRRKVVQSLQQVTDFLAPDGTEVFVFKDVFEYDELCSPADATGDDRWRCDLLLQVDAGDLEDGLTTVLKARMLRPGGIFAVLWAMKAKISEKEGLDVDLYPVKFSFARMERRVADHEAQQAKPPAKVNGPNDDSAELVAVDGQPLIDQQNDGAQLNGRRLFWQPCSQKSSTSDPRMQLIRQWRTYRSQEQEKRHVELMVETERELQRTKNES